MDNTLKLDLGKALSYFKARVQAMRSDEYLAAADTIIALKEECKSTAAFSKVLEEEGFTEEILPRNERSCITGWFADLEPNQRKRVIEWMTEREKNGESFRLQTAERHFAKQFNDEEEEPAKQPQAARKATPRTPPDEDDEGDDDDDDEDEVNSEEVDQLKKMLEQVKAKYTELELKLASATSQLSEARAKAAENKKLRDRIKELEAENKRLREEQTA